MMPRYGVYYDLAESPFKTRRDGIVYYFSSEIHRNRFERDVMERERIMSRSFAKRVGCWKVDMRLPAALQLYRQVETRGFLIYLEDKDVYVTCLEHLELSGPEVKSVG